jgi:UrcA family protein
MNIRIKSMVVPVAFVALAASATALQAQAMEESAVQASRIGTDSVVVSLDDLDLGSAEGRKAMDSRLRAAAKQVCGHEGSRRTGSLSHYAKTRACYKEALADARGQVSEKSLQVVAVTR